VASIADVYVTVLPETSKIGDGIKKALLAADDDVRRAAKRWKKEIDRELSDAEVEVTADTAKAKKEIQAVEKGRYRAEVKVDVGQASLAKTRALLSGGGGGGGGRAGARQHPRRRRETRRRHRPESHWRPKIVPAVGSVVSAVG
jgi:hypothetical protein